MKKTLKKLLCTVMALMMLLSVMGVQSLAAPSIGLPTATDVEVVLKRDVSLKSIGVFYDELRALYEEMSEDFGFDGMSFDDFLDSYAGGLMSYQLQDEVEKYIVTLSNGKTLEVPSEGCLEYNAFYDIFVWTTVTYNDYKEALDNDKKKINVDVEVSVSSEYGGGAFDKTANFEKSFKLVNCYVKSIKAVSGLPETCYVMDDYLQLEGAKFKITYADGKTKTAKVKTVFGDGVCDVSYTLDGEKFSYYFEDDETVCYTFIDGTVNAPIKMKNGDPFKKIKITDYTLDGAEVTSVSYDITWKNGTKKSYTNEVALGGEEIYATPEYIDGFCVYVYCTEPFGEEPEEGYDYITVAVGDHEDFVKYESVSGGSFLEKFVKALTDIIAKIMELFSK